MVGYCGPWIGQNLRTGGGVDLKNGLKKLVGLRVLGPIRSWDAESLV